MTLVNPVGIFAIGLNILEYFNIGDVQDKNFKATYVKMIWVLNEEINNNLKNP